jgi:hypothetical protein
MRFLKTTVLAFILFTNTINVGNCTSNNQLKDDVAVRNILIFKSAYQELRYFHPDSDFKNENWNGFLEKSIDLILDNSSINILKFLNESFSFLPHTYFDYSKNQDYTFSDKYNCKACYLTNYKGYSEEEEKKEFSIYKVSRKQVEKENNIYSKQIDNSNIWLHFPKYSPSNQINSHLLSDYKSKNFKTTCISNILIINSLANMFIPDSSRVKTMNINLENTITEILNTEEDDDNHSKQKFILNSYLSFLEDAHTMLTVTDKSEKSEFTWRILGFSASINSDTTLKVTHFHPKFSYIDNAIITELNGKSTKELYEEFRKTTSTRNKKDLEEIILYKMKFVSDTTNYFIKTIKGNNYETHRVDNFLSINEEWEWANAIIPKMNNVKLNDTITYINLTHYSQTTDKALQFMKKNVNKNTHLFLDLRGYPNKIDHIPFISSLTPKTIVDSFLLIPVQNIDTSYFEKSFWIVSPSDTQINYKKLYILIDHKTMSYAESLAYFLSKLQNSFLVGSETIGANGNISYATLNGFKLRFTAMKINYTNINHNDNMLISDLKIEIEKGIPYTQIISKTSNIK